MIKNAKHLDEQKKNGTGFKKMVQDTEFPFFGSPGIFKTIFQMYF